MPTHLVIPDAHASINVSNRRFDWLGEFILEEQPDVIIDIGDFGDLSTLGTYDVGTKNGEGKRILDEVACIKDASDRVFKRISTYNSTRTRHKKPQYNPRIIRCGGNHEEGRLKRFINENPRFEGLVTLEQMGFKDYNAEYVPYLKPKIVDDITYCLAPHHKVLTADLRYVPLGELKIGDELVGFDEESPKGRMRAYKTATVLKHDIDEAELFRVELSSGKTFDVTNDHLWLTRIQGGTVYRWKKTYQLVPSLDGSKRGTTIVAQVFDEWKKEESYLSGWISGIFDGEGYITKPNSKQGGIQIGISQNTGQTLEKIKSSLTKYGYKFAEWKHGNTKSCQSVRLHGTSYDRARFLGTFRPERLISKFRVEHLGRFQMPDNSNKIHFIKSITPLGLGKIVKIETTTKTMIVEGYPHHNCHFYYVKDKRYPISSAKMLLQKLHMSATCGHSHIRDFSEAARPDGKRIQGLIVGGYHDPENKDSDYAGPQGVLTWWSGVVMKYVNESGGTYSPRFIDIEELQKRYG